jgi:outer membrane receptor protein involved in Fe transport
MKYLASFVFLLISLPAFGQSGPAKSEPTKQAEAQTGTLSGMVVSFEDQRPIEGARVFVRGLTEEVSTDKRGHFSMQVPAGLWDVSVIHSDYSTASKSGVEVAADGETEITVEMTPISVRLETFTVRIPRIEGGTISLLEQRQETSQVADVIGAEQFSKTGDSNAAAALGRVTGLTVVGGKYVYVRGLGERYSSSLLNGSMLPSPDPERRVVPLDLFPTSILESVVVQKTYSADMPAGFGGGVIRMQTRSFPDEFTAGVNVSLGYDTQTTLADGLGYRGGSWDWIGVDDGTRALPETVKDAAAKSPLKPAGRFSDQGYTPERLAEIGRSMPNNYSTSRDTVMPDMGVSGTIGDTAELADLDVGYLFALGYDREHSRQLWSENIYTMGIDSPDWKAKYDLENLADTTELSGMFTGGVELDEHNTIKLTSVLSRITDDETRIYQGPLRDADTDLRLVRLRWLERQLLFEQIAGEHTLPMLGDTKIDWRYGFGQARRDEPDRREYRYDYHDDIGAFAFSDRPDGNSRVWSDLVDNTHDLGLAVSVPFEVWSSLEAKLKSGVDFFYKTREVSTRRFGFDARSPPPKQERTGPLEEQLSDEDINAQDGYVLGETTRPTDNYSANHLIAATYVLTELPLTDSLDLAAGVRLEQSTQQVNTFELFGDNDPIVSETDTLDVLPSTSLTWRFVEDMQLRGAVARTVNRPDFRELSPGCYDSVIGGRQTCGNPNLERAQITHLDARWEWYPARGEAVSVGLFYKDFTRPIELVYVPSANPQVTYQNAQGATNLGVEFDVRKELDFLSDWTRDFYVAGNLALIASEIRIDTSGQLDKDIKLTNTVRPLHGQSPYVLNMQFGYENPDVGTTATFLYNVYGARITEVGANRLPDAYQEPMHRVDFTLSQTLSEQFELGFKANNLLDARVYSSVGQELTYEAYRGRAFSLKLSWDY